MEKDAIYVVVGNRSEWMRHFCGMFEIVVGTGDINCANNNYYGRYERASFRKRGAGLQWISSKDVVKIGKL